MHPTASIRTDLHRMAAESAPLSRHRNLLLAGSVAVVAAIAIADFHTGYELRLAILYLIPIAAATWIHGHVAGLLVSTIAVTGWFLSFQSSHIYSHVFYYYWEGGVTAASYVVFTLLLARLRKALERSDERFVTVLEGIDASVLVTDASDGRLLYANRRCHEAFGALVPTGVAGEHFSAGSEEFHDAATGRWYFVQTRTLRWIDAREAVLRVFSDITAEKRAHDLIGKHRDSVHRTSKLVALGEFASAIAHELNQPLAAIATYSNTSLRLLESGRYDTAELRDAMDKCLQQTKRAGSIIQRLREFLRLRGPSLAELDLNEVAKEACSLARAEAMEAAAAIELNLAPGLPSVLADRVLIEQVVLNLVRNAIEASPPGERPVHRVCIASEALADGSAVIRVSDSGTGVPEEVHGRLFEAFATTKPGGLGLGLSICRSVVEAHGGSIGHEPNPGGGSVFWFTLPAKRN